MKDILNDEDKEEMNNLNIPIEIKYSLKKANNDNNLEYKIFNEDDSGNIINIQSNKKEIKVKRQEINYALIVKNVSNDILNKMDVKYFDDEYKINLLLMSSLEDISIKSICLYFKYKFN